jgi:Holliday junction resolvasome RuvABC endonuclease subunit
MDISEKIAADAADALAAAVCHIHREAFQARILEAAAEWNAAVRPGRAR